MQTIILSAQDITPAAETIKNGGLAAFPTETVYGLGADAFCSDAVKAIFAAKGRPQDNPLIVHFSDVADIQKAVETVPESFFKIYERFMPGPISVVMKASKNLPKEVTAGGDTVAVRFPSHPVARALITLAGTPIAAPSANRSAHVSPTTAQHVYDDLCGKIPYIIDGGACDVGLESTVLDLTSDVPVILRPGAITAEMLLEIFDEIKVAGVASGIARSPGMKYRHYSPAAPVVLEESIESAIKIYDEKTAKNLSPVLIFTDDCKKTVGTRNFLSLGKNADDAAKLIYGRLREADKQFNFLIVQAFVGGGIENALKNRLEKAANVD